MLAAIAGCLLGLACRGSHNAPDAAACSSDAATALYTRKIEPILRDDRPTSCNQCHLSGIDLSLFVRDTPCQTMACMTKLGLVDVAAPEQSKVLSWIERAKPQSELITESVIEAEYEGMLEWISYSARCGGQVCPKFDDPCNDKVPGAGARCDVELAVGTGYADPGDCQESTLEQLFSANVFQWRERCYPCHFSSDKTVQNAPKWIRDIDATIANPELACAASSLETMRTVLMRGLVNLEAPAESFLLRKPLPPQLGGLQHGGGPKFTGPEDPSYQTFLAWITRYGSCAAQDPSLQKASPPPPEMPPSTATPGTTPPDATSSIYDYCNCMLLNCHDAAHLKWGESDEQLLAGCRAEAISLPALGAATTAGNYLECRAAHCVQAKENLDLCDAAFGNTICRSD